MSEVGNSSRTGALLPTTPILEQTTWDHTTTMNGRRLLPSPGPKKVKLSFLTCLSLNGFNLRLHKFKNCQSLWTFTFKSLQNSN